MARIAWIADYTSEGHPGGAQKTNGMMIKYGRDVLGHYIEEITAKNFDVHRIKSDFDIAILNNVTSFSYRELLRLIAAMKVVRYEHDYWVADHSPKLYAKVKKTIFLSPLHRKTAKTKSKLHFHTEVVPSPIDIDLFSPGDTEREENSVLWAGGMSLSKGSEEFLEFIERNTRLKFYVVGWGDMFRKFGSYKNVEVIDTLTHEELVKYYQRCQYFYHRPQWNEPFGRTVMEAFLCGCDLITNDRVGALSFDWDYSDYDAVAKELVSEFKFWNIIENEI